MIQLDLRTEDEMRLALNFQTPAIEEALWRHRPDHRPTRLGLRHADHRQGAAASATPWRASNWLLPKPGAHEGVADVAAGH